MIPQKTIFILVSIIILLIAAVIAYFLFFKGFSPQTGENNQNYSQIPKEEILTLPTEEELASWTDYKSEGFSFEVKYPKDWTKIFSSKQGLEIVSFNSLPEPIEGREDLTSAPKIVFTVMAIADNESPDFEKAVEAEKQRMGRYYPVAKKQESKVLLKGISGQKLVFDDENGYAVDYVFLKEGTIYKIIGELIEKDQKFIETFQKIVSTFKF